MHIRQLPPYAEVLVAESGVYVASNGNLVAYSPDLVAELWSTRLG